MDLHPPICEKTEAADKIRFDNVILSANSEKVSNIQNRCCGIRLYAPHTVGPFLKFWGLERMAVDQAGGSQEARPAVEAPSMWLGSVLIVTQAKAEEVVVALTDAQGSNLTTLKVEALDAYDGWVALRYRVCIPVEEQQKKVHYSVTVCGKALQPSDGGGRYSFYVAGKLQPAHWGFYSCSGFSSDVPPKHRQDKWKGITPLWNDVRAVHDKNPLHLLVGGGDQLYCDDLWTLPSLASFLERPRKTEQEREAKKQAKYDDQMQGDVGAYYFHHYCCHFSQSHIGDVYALVPQVMSWDDHDIFDGWGSYPPYLQDSKVFQGIFGSALRWYCIFQQHCRPEEKLPVAVYDVGCSTAIVACDMRHKRRPDEILPLEYYMKLSLLCTQLPKPIDHVVFVSTVPVVYPHLTGARSLLTLLKNGLLQCCLGSIGAKQLNQFGEPDLIDDLDDHWSAPDHREERRFLIENLQMLAKYRGCRVTLLSGDVHVCGAGRVVSNPAPPDDMLRYDFRYMHQVISSAISNPPPPGVLIKVLDYLGNGGRINKATRLAMTRELKNHLGVRNVLENKRNWCEVQEHMVSRGILELPFVTSLLPSSGRQTIGSRFSNQADDGHMLVFKLRVEDTPGKVESVQEYNIVVPPLQKLPNKDEYYDSRSKGRHGGCFSA